MTDPEVDAHLPEKVMSIYGEVKSETPEAKILAEKEEALKKLEVSKEKEKELVKKTLKESKLALRDIAELFFEHMRKKMYEMEVLK
jgi:hypothetical protein